MEMEIVNVGDGKYENEATESPLRLYAHGDKLKSSSNSWQQLSVVGR